MFRQPRKTELIGNCFCGTESRLRRGVNCFCGTESRLRRGVIDNIMTIAMNEVREYVQKHDICPRDATGLCVMVAHQSLAGYTIKRGIDLRKTSG